MSSIGSNRAYLLESKPVPSSNKNDSKLETLIKENNKTSSKAKLLDKFETKDKPANPKVSLSYSFLENNNIIDKFNLANEAVNNFENKINIMSSLLSKGLTCTNDKSIIISSLNNLNKSRTDAIKKVEDAINIYNSELKKNINSGNPENSQINSYKEKYTSFYSKFEKLKVLDKNVVDNINKLLNCSTL